MRISLLVFALLAPGYLSGCGGPVDTTVDLFLGSHAILLLRVVDSANESPVEGAAVEGSVFASDCEASKFSLRGIRTNANGESLVRLEPSNTAPFEGCLRISVAPPEDSGLAPADTSGIRIDLVDPESIPDTTFVEVSLPRE